MEFSSKAASQFLDGNASNYTRVLTLAHGGNATFAGNILIADDKKIQFGTLPDLEIYHDEDNSYIKEVKNTIRECKIDILHVLDGKSLRNCVVAVKKEQVRLITYFGSASLYWHDLSSYLTYLNPRVEKIICNSSYFSFSPIIYDIFCYLFNRYC